MTDFNVEDETPAVKVSELTPYAKAKAAALKKYFTGKPCKAGHVDERWVSNFSCCKCMMITSTSPEGKANKSRWSSVWRALPSVKERKIELSAKPERINSKRSYYTSPVGRAVKAKYDALPGPRSKHIQRMNARRRFKDSSPLSPADLDGLFYAQSGICAYFGVDARCKGALVRGTNGCHADHKIPRARDGLNVIDNMQFLCGHCNGSKHTKTDAEFRAWLIKRGFNVKEDPHGEEGPPS